MEHRAPILKAKELAEFFSPLFSITQQDLAKPTPEKMRALYEFIAHLTGIHRDEIDQPDQHAGLWSEYSDMPKEGLTEISWYYAISRLARAACIHDFSMRHDVLEPQPKRVAEVLSGLANFILFREEQLSNFEPLCSEASAHLERREALLQEQQQLQQQVEQLREAHKQVAPALAALRDENSALEQQVQSLNKRQATLVEESRSHKADTKANKEASQVLRQRNNEAQQQNLRLRSKIVQSPRKLAKVIEDMNENVEEHRNEINENERRCRELSARTEALGKLKKDVQQSTAQMEATYAKLDSAKQARRAAKELDRRLSDTTHSVTELETETQLLDRKLDAAKAKMAHMRETLNAQIAAAQRTLDEAVAERMRFEREELVAVGRQKHNNQLESERIEALRDSERLAFDEELAHIHKQHERLRLQVDAYHQSLIQAMGLAV
jgi:kinetochore protein Nuf2